MLNSKVKTVAEPTGFTDQFVTSIMVWNPPFSSHI